MTEVMPMRTSKFYCPVFAALTTNELVVCLIPSPRSYPEEQLIICDTCKRYWKWGNPPDCDHCKQAWEYIDDTRKKAGVYLPDM